MKLKELLDAVSCGVQYKLLGAMTGKQLANSYTNKEGYIKSFWEDEVSGFFPSYDVQINTITKTPKNIRPIICIYLSGR